MKDCMHLFRNDLLYLEEHDQEELELRRIKTAKFCVESNIIASGSETTSHQQYRLDLTRYSTQEGHGNYSSANIYRGQDLIMRINRNFGSFWGHWVLDHPKTGHDYLLCGEDYQGYNVIDLTAKINYAYLPKAAKQGFGWCWCQVESFDASTMKLSVLGCFWACPYDRITFDFSDPTQIPLPILAQEDLDGEEDIGEEHADGK